MPSLSSSSSPESSEPFLAAIVESSNDAIISRDLMGTITSWNPAAARIFGYTAAEAIGRPITILSPVNRLQEESTIVQRTLKGERIQHYETVRRHKDGTSIDTRLTVSAIRDADGAIVGLSTIARDIRAETLAHERFRVTLMSIGDAVLCTDMQGRITFMNAVAERLTGWTMTEAINQPMDAVFRIVNERSRQTVESPATRALREGVVVGLANHTILLSRQGTECPIDDSAAPIRSSAGDLIGVVLVFRDVTERRQTEISLHRLAAIVEGSDDAIIGKDLQGTITTWNPGAQRIFGYTPEEMIGQPISKLIPPDLLEEEQRILARVQQGERVDHFETIRLHQNGRRIHVSLTISPIRNEEGEIIGASKISRDITAQKQSEQALRAAQAKLESHALELERTVAERTARLQEIVSELEAFSYSLSHDLRAPLRAIQGFTEIVLTDYADKIPEGAEYLRRVVNASARMDRLIQDVLAFARVSRQDIVVGPTDVDKLVHDIIEERPELRAPKAVVEIASPLLPVIGHDASLSQCLTNLLDNAVKFVPPGTTPHVRVFTEAHGGRVKIHVQDNGIGIDVKGQRKLFAVFQRLAPAQRYQGTGVGLAIVRKAAERMGGSVGVMSEPDQGSTFWVELPKADGRG